MDVKLGLSLTKFSVKCKPYVNRCLRYILRIWWPNIIPNKDLWKVTEQEDINLENKKNKIWMDWSHINLLKPNDIYIYVVLQR